MLRSTSAKGAHTIFFIVTHKLDMTQEDAIQSVDQEQGQPQGCDDRRDDDDELTRTPTPTAPYFYYRDFSGLPDPEEQGRAANKRVSSSANRIPNFPTKLMDMLSRPDLAHIISWMPHGRSWKVHKPREFEIRVIPMFFEHSKFSSFIRQANGWGFRRMVRKGPDLNSYYHEIFLRGNPHLIKLMKRPTVTVRPPSDARTEPDFYKIAEERPLPEASPPTSTHPPCVNAHTDSQREDSSRESNKPRKETSHQPSDAANVLASSSSQPNHSAPNNKKPSALSTSQQGHGEPNPYSSSFYSAKHLEAYRGYETLRKYTNDERPGRFPTVHVGPSTLQPWANVRGWERNSSRQHQLTTPSQPFHFDNSVNGGESISCFEPIPVSQFVSHSVLHPVSPGGGSWSAEHQKQKLRDAEPKLYTRDLTFPIDLWSSDELW